AAYTAPYFGSADAEDYYHGASAMRVIDRVRVPSLIITSEDDPFVPSQPFRDPKVAGNPHIDPGLCAHARTPHSPRAAVPHSEGRCHPPHRPASVRARRTLRVLRPRLVSRRRWLL